MKFFGRETETAELLKIRKDLVCEDSINRRLDFYEVKRDLRHIDLTLLKTKMAAFYAKNPELRSLTSEYRGLSLADM